jgi:hypothetical protein
MSTSIRTAAGQQQQHTYGPVDTIDMFPLMNCGESADLGELLDGPSGMNGDKGLSQRFPAWGDVSLSDAADIGLPPYSGNISGGSMPLVPPPMMTFSNNNGYSLQPPMQEYQQFIPNAPMPYQMKQQQQQQQQQQPYWNFPAVQQQQPDMKVVGPNGMAYPIWWQNVNGTLMPYFATLPIYNGTPPSSDSDSGNVTQFVASSEPSVRRQACLDRYRKKKARRSFKKHIRYQMRKDNADKRRRVKGRFVRSIDNEAGAKDPSP